MSRWASRYVAPPQTGVPVAVLVSCAAPDRVDDWVVVTSDAAVRMAAKAPSDKGFGETHPGDLP